MTRRSLARDLATAMLSGPWKPDAIQVRLKQSFQPRRRTRWLSPGSQNREKRACFREHLRGRVAYVMMINARRGAKLQQIFERIEWDENAAEM